MSDERLISKLDSMLNQLSQYDTQLADPEVAIHHEKVTEISQKRAAIESLCSLYQQYKSALSEANDLREFLAGNDLEMKQLAKEELPNVEQLAQQLLDQIKGDLVTADDRTVGSVILEIRAGVGGDEAGIWAGDLYLMYEKFALDSRWKWHPMQFSPNEMGGCKAATVNIKGDGVWQMLGYEGGTHCVKRVPATESQGRIHTSTATVAVLPEPEKVQVVINTEDVEIDITTSQGPGGQNVNKVATAVKMKHKPTGIEVRMQDTKSQRQNRELAWQLLRARLHDYYQQKKNAERAESRAKMIGSGHRGERIRTYRWKDNIAVDHRIGKSFNLQEIMAGRLTDMIHALIEQDKAQRLAAL